MMKKKEVKHADEGFWDEIWTGFSLPAYFDKNDRLLSTYDKHFRKNFPKCDSDSQIKILEIGCAASRCLPYFKKEFGYEIWGIDISKVGCLAAKENLRLHDIEGNIVLGDIFESNPIPEDYFNVVYSLGFVEHFENPAQTLRYIAKYPKKGGLVFTQIPNICGLYGYMLRLFKAKHYAVHYPISLEEFIKAHHDAGLEAVDVPGHINIINIAMFPYPINSLPMVVQNIIKTLIDYIDRGAAAILSLFPKGPFRNWFSPSIAGTFRKA
jgi:SAM-dependent methyltransferase